MSHCASLCCSKALGLQEFCRQTQEQLEARREVQPDRPILDGDVTTMAVKFERSVRARARTHTHTSKVNTEIHQIHFYCMCFYI